MPSILNSVLDMISFDTLLLVINRIDVKLLRIQKAGFGKLFCAHSGLEKTALEEDERTA